MNCDSFELMNFTTQSLLHSTHDFMFVKDKNFLYVGASEAFAIECAGHSCAKELIGKNDFEIFEDQELAAKYRKDDESIFESRLPMIEYKESYPDKEGQKRYCLTTKYIILDKEGNPAGIFGQCRDITEQVELENKGREQQLLLSRQESIFNALRDIYYLILYFDLKNDRYYQVAGSKYIFSVPGKEECELPASGSLTAFVKNRVNNDKPKMTTDEANEEFSVDVISDRLSSEGIIIKEMLTVSLGWVRTSLIPVDYDSEGKVSSCLCVGESIDAEKRKELQHQEALKDAYQAAIRANSAKTEFLSKVSHDIRTPMNVIIGMTDIAANSDDKICVQECIKKINTASKHLLALVNEVLDMSKIESGNIEITEESFEFTKFVDNVVEMITPLVNKKAHTLEVKYEKLRHDEVIGDRLHIQQLFMNILGNAIKYTPEGGHIQLVVREEKCHQPLLATYVCVFKDNGIGMSEEYVEHIFEPFSREEDSRTNKVLGTGLGMSIVNNIVRMLGGEIKVESKKGKGSTFTVSFHLKIQSESSKEISVDENFKQTKSDICNEEVTTIENNRKERFSNRRVLVVEDQEFNREICRFFLNMAGVQYEEAENGLQAVTMIENSTEAYYDMIFMDVQMPVMNGYEATRKIRSLNRNDVKTIPIIAMTANAFVSDINAAIESGMNEHMSKPIDLSKFNEMLDKWLDE